MNTVGDKGFRQTRNRGGPLNWPKQILERYRPAILALRRALRNLPGDKLLALEYHLVNECEAAIRAKVRAKDKHATRRRSDKRSIERTRSLVKAAKTVAGYMREFPDQATFIVGMVLPALRERGLRISLQSGHERATPNGETPSEFVPDKKEFELSKAMALLAEQLARSAVELNPARRGPWMHRTSIPGAMFDKALDQGKHKRLPDWATVLGFHLVFWLRAFTTAAETGKGVMVSAGAAIPEAGKPHYNVAEEFVLCALGESAPAGFNLADRLRKLPQLQYGDW